MAAKYEQNTFFLSLGSHEKLGVVAKYVTYMNLQGKPEWVEQLCKNVKSEEFPPSLTARPQAAARQTIHVLHISIILWY